MLALGASPGAGIAAALLGSAAKGCAEFVCKSVHSCKEMHARLPFLGAPPGAQHDLLLTGSLVHCLCLLALKGLAERCVFSGDAYSECVLARRCPHAERCMPASEASPGAGAAAGSIPL